MTSDAKKDASLASDGSRILATHARHGSGGRNQDWRVPADRRGSVAIARLQARESACNEVRADNIFEQLEHVNFWKLHPDHNSDKFTKYLAARKADASRAAVRHADKADGDSDNFFL